MHSGRFVTVAPRRQHAPKRSFVVTRELTDTDRAPTSRALERCRSEGWLSVRRSRSRSQILRHRPRDRILSQTSPAWASRLADTRSRSCVQSSPACTHRPRRSCVATRTESPRAAGIVIGRQRPGTASGVVFVTLEDEIASINAIVWRDLRDRHRHGRRRPRHASRGRARAKDAARSQYAGRCRIGDRDAARWINLFRGSRLGRSSGIPCMTHAQQRCHRIVDIASSQRPADSQSVAERRRHVLQGVGSEAHTRPEGAAHDPLNVVARRFRPGPPVHRSGPGPMRWTPPSFLRAHVPLQPSMRFSDEA
jgi:hypothetical protein